MRSKWKKFLKFWRDALLPQGHSNQLPAQILTFLIYIHFYKILTLNLCFFLAFYLFKQLKIIPTMFTAICFLF